MDFSQYHKKMTAIDNELIKSVKNRLGSYAERVSPIPQSFIRISANDEIDINGNLWRIIIGEGHAPEHACLYCEKLKLLI